MTRTVTRFENGLRTTNAVEPLPFGPDRAAAILRSGSQWANYERWMTDGEIAHVLNVWDTMPGRTCFYDALVRISRGQA